MLCSKCIYSMDWKGRNGGCGGVFVVLWCFVCVCEVLFRYQGYRLAIPWQWESCLINCLAYTSQDMQRHCLACLLLKRFSRTQDDLLQCFCTGMCHLSILALNIRFRSSCQLLKKFLALIVYSRFRIKGDHSWAKIVYSERGQTASWILGGHR
jgi:hypothetical protein